MDYEGKKEPLEDGRNTRKAAGTLSCPGHVYDGHMLQKKKRGG